MNVQADKLETPTRIFLLSQALDRLRECVTQLEESQKSFHELAEKAIRDLAFANRFAKQVMDEKHQLYELIHEALSKHSIQPLKKIFSKRNPGRPRLNELNAKKIIELYRPFVEQKGAISAGVKASLLARGFKIHRNSDLKMIRKISDSYRNALRRLSANKLG